MTLSRSESDAPHLGRSVLIAPGRRINLAQAGHPLATIRPRTKVGALALDVTMQASIATIQIVATTAYCQMLNSLVAPPIIFSAPPPNTKGITVEQLRTGYDSFNQQLASLQINARQWMSMGENSLFTRLGSIAQVLVAIDDTVESNFSLLKTLPVGTPAFKKLLKDLDTQIGSQIKPLQALDEDLKTFASTLNSTATALNDAATTGVLKRLIDAYKNEMAALDAAIADAVAAISNANSKIIGLGFAAAAAIAVGVVGLLTIWSPVGWFLMAGGGVGAYFAITEIQSLKGQIAALTGAIQLATQALTTDAAAAAAVSGFARNAMAAAAMNQEAQKELNTLVKLCGTLSTDLKKAIEELDADDLKEALAEWSDVVKEATFLEGITLYIWPDTLLLQNPGGLAATGTTAFLVGNDGTAYSIAAGANGWTTLPGTSLSIVAGGGTVVGIDAAPWSGTAGRPENYGDLFFAKTYNAATGWTTISNFPVAQVATDGSGGIWAVSQVKADRQVYHYTGSDKSWSPVGAMPANDAPSDIGAHDRTVFAIANNGGGLWYAAKAEGWKQIGTATYSRLSANDGWLGLIDTDGNAWIANVRTAGSYAPTPTMKGVALLAQAPNGDQYATDANLNLWRIAHGQGGAPVSTQLRSNVVGIAVSGNGTVYATDNIGDIWMLADPDSGAWKQLPALPAD